MTRWRRRRWRKKKRGRNDQPNGLRIADKNINTRTHTTNGITHFSILIKLLCGCYHIVGCYVFHLITLLFLELKLFMHCYDVFWITCYWLPLLQQQQAATRTCSSSKYHTFGQNESANDVLWCHSWILIVDLVCVCGFFALCISSFWYRSFFKWAITSLYHVVHHV